MTSRDHDDGRRTDAESPRSCTQMIVLLFDEGVSFVGGMSSGMRSMPSRDEEQ
jgi:hypothetical protein